MSSVKGNYVATAVAIPNLLLASLADGAVYQSDPIDNSANVDLDHQIDLQVKMGAAAPTGDIHVLIADAPDGTHFGSPFTSAHGLITGIQKDQLFAMKPGQRLIGSNAIYVGAISCRNQAAAAVVNGPAPRAIAALYGFSMPYKYVVIVVNMTGQALDATEGNHTKQYTRWQQQVV